MVFAYSAKRADEVGRQVFEGDAGSYVVVGVADCGVVNPSAYITYVFIHGLKYLMVTIYNNINDLRGVLFMARHFRSFENLGGDCYFCDGKDYIYALPIITIIMQS